MYVWWPRGIELAYCSPDSAYPTSGVRNNTVALKVSPQGEVSIEVLIPQGEVSVEVLSPQVEISLSGSFICTV